GRVAEQDPASVPALLGLAAAHWALGRPEDALARARQLMALPRPPAQGWLEVARAWLPRHDPRDPKKAEAVAFVLQKAAEQDPGSVDVLLARADALAPREDTDREDLDKLTRELAAAKAKDPKRAEVWVALAALAQRRGDAAEALTILDEA